MEWLYTNTEVSLAGYPLAFFYVIAAISLVLLFVRPYWAFLVAAFFLSACNYHAAVFTRTPFAGPYLNLNDLLEWITIFAMLMEFFRYKRKIWMPGILLALFGLVIIGDIQSLYKYGFAENVLRRIWSTAIFPIMFLVAANMVKGEKRAKNFYWTLFFGAVLAAIQHMVFVGYQLSHGFQNYMSVRTISFLGSGGIYFLIGAFYWPMKETRGLKLFGYYFALGSFFLSYLFSLTRTVWVSAILSVISIPFILGRSVNISKTMFKIGAYVTVGFIIAAVLFPQLSLTQIGCERVKSFTSKERFSKSYMTRKEGLETELDIWLRGTIILGAGASLPLEYVRADPYETGALGHVALTTYLSHYGLIGVLIYLVLLPLKSAKISKTCYLLDFPSYQSRVALVALACILMGVLACLSSVHYIWTRSHVPGLLYGAVWGIWRYSRNKGVKGVY